MKLSYNKKSKDPIYYVQKGFRNGNKTTTKNIARIGKHSELLKITDDPLTYAKEQVAKYNQEEKNNKISMNLTIDFDEKIRYSDSISSRSSSLNIGYFFLQQLYYDLNIHSFFNKVTKESKVTFDSNLVNRFLTYDRILYPGSKLASQTHFSRYYEQPSIGYHHILRTMDILANHYDEYISHLFDSSCKILKRNTSVCYYDCTNYYFEIESPDDDYIDEVTGEVIKGFRKYGMSKQHQPAPLVEMGLFMDADGIPLTMSLTSGSDNEQTTAIPLEKKLLKMFHGKPFIYCADAGLGSLNIRNFNSMGGRAFIVTQSIRKLSKDMQEKVFNGEDFHLLSDDSLVDMEMLKTFDKTDPKNKKLYSDKAYKVLPANKMIDLGLYEEKLLKNGKTRKVKSKALVPQSIIITFSRKTMEYQRFIRNRQIERAKAILRDLDPESYKKGPHDVTRFIKRTSTSKSGNTVIDSYELDLSAIEEEAKYDGYYAIATNLEDEVEDIIQISSQRYKIEDCFRLMKTNFSARPVYHHNKERIIAHFMICYTALLMYRLLEKKFDNKGIHYTPTNIIETLQNMNVINIEDMCYRSTYTSSQVCTSLNEIFDLRLDRKYYQPKELNKKLKNF
ncbi:Transposase [Lachnospiraceae bacterium TWA4]|nr:Transposase [Lachnospiraceae bacterium TWA4]